MTVALYTGLFVAIEHLVWSLMVAFGMGQIFIYWIMGLHFIENPFVILPFNLGTMIVHVVFTFVIGFILGWVGTICWNKMIKK